MTRTKYQVELVIPNGVTHDMLKPMGSRMLSDMAFAESFTVSSEVIDGKLIMTAEPKL